MVPEKKNKNKNIENQKLGKNVGLSKYIHSRKDDHNFLVDLEPFNLGDGVEDCE